MPHLRIIYDIEGWAYHNCAKGLAKYAPPDFRITMSPIRRNGERIEDTLLIGDEPVDLFFDLVGSTISRLRPLARERGWVARFIGAFSNGWPLHLNALSRTYRDCDAMLVSSRSYWQALGPAEDTFTLPYGVDPEIFRVRVPPETRAPKVIWTGSHFHRAVKGYDNIILPLADRLREKGIAFEARLVDSYGSDRVSLEQMADWYNGATVILCASRAEGTPNPPLEAAACGCTVVSTPVGNMPEFIRPGENGFLVERRVGAFVEGIEKAIAAYPRLSAQIVEDIRPWLWDRHAERFFDIFRTVIATGHPPAVPGLRPRPVDLREDLTVFVTTVGMPSYPDCLAALARQDSLFRIETIENVAPLTQALQMMLDNCRTPYLVQVDEDMILHPHAIRTLLTHAKGADPSVAGVVYNLFDAHLGRSIRGVKIYRHDIVRRYPWTPDTTVFDRNRRIESDGHQIVRMPHGADDPAEHPHVLGLHGTKWTPRQIFERYYTLRMWRNHSADLQWTDGYLAEFAGRFGKEPDALNFYALMGMVAGTLAHNDCPVPPKDHRIYHMLPGFDAARSFLGSFRRLEEERRADGEAIGTVRTRTTESAEATSNALLPEFHKLIEGWGGQVAEAKLITSLPVPLRSRQTWRITYADGQRVKLRILDGEAAAERRERVARTLPAGDFARFLKRHGRALLEEWVDGRSVAEMRRSESVLRACGETMGRLHRASIGHHASGNKAPSQGHWWLKVLRKNGDELAAAGHLEQCQLVKICDAAESTCPGRVTVGLVHGDLCPENAVLASTGRLVIVDNEAVKEGPLAYDIARCRRRWPLDAEGERILLEGYARHADPGEYVRSAAFWHLFVAVEALAYWVHAGAQVDGDEVGRLVEEFGRVDAVHPAEAVADAEAQPSARAETMPPAVRLAHDLGVVELSGLSEPHLGWVTDFLSPAFVPSARVADTMIRLHPAAEPPQTPATQDGAVRTPLYIADGGRGGAWAWRRDDGTCRIRDEESRASLAIGAGPRIDLWTVEARQDLRLALLRLLRDLATWRALAKGAVLLHASAFALDGSAVAIAGHKGSGKTTLLLQAPYRAGAQILANDRVLVGADLPARVIGVPTIVKLPRDTMDLFPELAAEIAGQRLNYLDTATERQQRPEATVVSRQGSFNLSPGQLCRVMGIGRGAAGWLSAVMFPEIDAAIQREEMVELDRAAGLQRLHREALFPLAMPPGPLAEFAGVAASKVYPSPAELDLAVGGARFFAWRTRPGRHDRAFADAIEAAL